jgi:hypothetical protein
MATSPDLLHLQPIALTCDFCWDCSLVCYFSGCYLCNPLLTSTLLLDNTTYYATEATSWLLGVLLRLLMKYDMRKQCSCGFGSFLLSNLTEMFFFEYSSAILI